jgi:hypothetical protein
MGFIKNYGLSIVLLFLFLFSWLGHGIFQHYEEKEAALMHGRQLETKDYLVSFGQSTFENWQSEFLQLFAMVVLTAVLIHRGSAESKDSNEKIEAALSRIEKEIGSKR